MYAPHVLSGCGKFSEIRTPRSLRLRKFFKNSHPTLTPAAGILKKVLCVKNELYSPAPLQRGDLRTSTIFAPHSRGSHSRGSSRLFPLQMLHAGMDSKDADRTMNIHATTMGNNSCTRQQQKKRTVTAPAPSRSRFGRRQLSHQTLRTAPFF
jgi:hypothetical protein